MAVDDDFGDVGQQFAWRDRGGSVKLEQFGRLVEEPRRHVAGEELRVVDQVQEERDVRLHAANAELLEAALHSRGGVLEASGRSPVTFTSSES